jgi:hypothetical protein
MQRSGERVTNIPPNIERSVGMMGWMKRGRGAACVVIILCGCGRLEPSPAGPSSPVSGPVRLTISADQTSGAVPLTVTFTGKLSGTFDTLLTRVPEVSLTGGSTADAGEYSSLPDTLAPARPAYTAREHYFRAGTFRAVMHLHARGGDVASDTLVVTVYPD